MALWRMQTLLGDIHGTEEKQAILLAQLQAEGLPEKKKGNAGYYSNHYQGRKKASLRMKIAKLLHKFASLPF